VYTPPGQFTQMPTPGYSTNSPGTYTPTSNTSSTTNDWNPWALIGSAGVGAAGQYFQGRNTSDMTDDNRALSDESRKLTLGEIGDSWEDISKWLTPYLDAGTWALDKYKQGAGMAPDTPVFKDFDQGDPFAFDYKDFDQNPAYQFVRDQGLQATDRLQAKNRNLGSGNRLTAAQNYASGLASTEYGNEFGRQLDTYNVNYDNRFGAHSYNNTLQQQRYQNENTRYDKNQGGYKDLLTLGAGATQNMASFRDRASGDRQDAYADYAAEQGSANIVDANSQNQLVDAITRFGAPLVTTLLEKHGGSVANVLTELFGGGDVAGAAAGAGGAAGTAASMFGGGAASGMGTGVGAMTGGTVGPSAMGAPAGWETVGAMGAEASGGGVAGAGAGATAMAATPLIGFGAVIALDQLLGSSPQIGKTREALSESSDPVGFILNMSNSDLSGLSMASMTGVSGLTEKRGLFFSTMVANMDPQGIEALKADPRAGDMIDSMLAFNSSAMQMSPKAGGGWDDSGLTTLFPEHAADFKAMKDASYMLHNIESLAEDNRMHPSEVKTIQDQAENEMRRISARLYSSIYNKVASWGG